MPVINVTEAAATSGHLHLSFRESEDPTDERTTLYRQTKAHKSPFEPSEVRVGKNDGGATSLAYHMYMDELAHTIRNPKTNSFFLDLGVTMLMRG